MNRAHASACAALLALLARCRRAVPSRVGAEEPPIARSRWSSRQAAAARRSGCRACRASSTSPRMDWTLGRYGGEVRTLMAKDRDIRMMVVYGYARLVGYDEQLQLVPDILEKRRRRSTAAIFTLHLRHGHKWSDGQPFTTEDFRYFWEDVANNKELSPVGLPRRCSSTASAPKFEVLNETTVRYTWDEPNPHFLPALAAPSRSSSIGRRTT